MAGADRPAAPRPDGRAASAPLPPDGANPPEAPQDAVLATLGSLAGLATSSVLLARLARAAALRDQAALLPPDIDQPAWAALLDAVTVQETCFFRTPAQWQALRETVLPVLLPRAAAAGRPLRLLSAGCATGEEAWSLAALGTEAAEALAASGVAPTGAPGIAPTGTLGIAPTGAPGVAPTGAPGGTPTGAPGGAPRSIPGVAPVPVKVIGLDISRLALRAAEAAIYRGPPDPLREMPALYRRFVELREAVRPAASLRPGVRFQRANLLRWDGSAEPQDIILCRNVLVYLTDAARQAVLARLAAALRPGGALVLGPLDRPPPGLGLAPWTGGSIGLYRREGADA